MSRRSTPDRRGGFLFRRRSRWAKAVLAVRTVGWLSWRLSVILFRELRSRAAER
jgi:hypothetical protein